ncbi:hypothetical protein TRIUR3_31529 [Triticum urartu]|uniref:Uncharacterized protein n=1 Tax=Triticum urartu TaxID=4572 RepID=M7ZIL8_TRIUA|nr:hypothetical protein TRIUR3_31529 [Triticum urartu]
MPSVAPPATNSSEQSSSFATSSSSVASAPSPDDLQVPSRQPPTSSSRSSTAAQDPAFDSKSTFGSSPNAVSSFGSRQDQGPSTTTTDASSTTVGVHFAKSDYDMNVYTKTLEDFGFDKSEDALVQLCCRVRDRQDR